MEIMKLPRFRSHKTHTLQNSSASEKKPITHTKREKKQNKKIANANENKEKKDAL